MVCTMDWVVLAKALRSLTILRARNGGLEPSLNTAGRSLQAVMTQNPIETRLNNHGCLPVVLLALTTTTNTNTMCLEGALSVYAEVMVVSLTCLTRNFSLTILCSLQR